MNDSREHDQEPGGRFLLGRRCLTVHHGTLWVDARVAAILGLSENETLPERTDETPESATPQASRPLELTPIHHVRPSRKGLIRLGAIVIAFAVFTAFQAQRLWSHGDAREIPIHAPGIAATPSAPPNLPKPPAAEVRLNDDGVPVDIRATEAAAVLAAFCKASKPSGERKPIGLSQTRSLGASAVLGRFEDSAFPAEQKAILIYLDPRISRWRAGTGAGPIAPLSTEPNNGP